MPLLLGLLSSVLWGTSDFLGGTITRRVPVTSVLLVSQLVALVALLPAAGATGGFLLTTDYLAASVAAGLIGMVALAAFFRALAEGTMGVVAPIAALGVVVPVLIGLARGESPNTWQAAGMAVAVGGVVLACGPELSGAAAGRGGRRVLGLALVAALGFGLVIQLVAVGSRGSGSSVARILMVLLTMRVASTVVLGARLLVVGSRRPAPAWGCRRSDLPALVAIGLFDVGANGSFAFASRQALVSVVSVLASLYPVVTLLLARRFQDERLRPIQLAGVAAALAGVSLLSAG